MFEIRYFNNKFSKIAKRWRLCVPNASLISDFGDLKLRDLLKTGFQTDMTKSNLKNQLRGHFSDVIIITTPKTSPN